MMPKTETSGDRVYQSENAPTVLASNDGWTLAGKGTISSE